MGGTLPESSADGKLPKGKLDHKLVFWETQATDGRESCAPVYLLEGGIGPVLFGKEVRTEPWSACCIKEGLAELTWHALPSDSKVCMTVRIVQDRGVELTDAELVGGKMVADHVELGWPRKHFEFRFFVVLVALDVFASNG
jgi:hypothetical protein